MTKLELKENKTLKVLERSPIFVGENGMDKIKIIFPASKIGNYDISACDFILHIVFPDATYTEYELSGGGGTADVPITIDMTSQEGRLKLYIEIILSADDTVIGVTNTIELYVNNLVNEVMKALKREEILAFYEQMLSTKLDNAPGAVKTTNIDNGAVTTAKLANGAVTSAKIGSGEVKQANLAASSVTGAAINNGAVSEDKLGADVIDILGNKFNLDSSNYGIRITKAQFNELEIEDYTVYATIFKENFFFEGSSSTSGLIIQLGSELGFSTRVIIRANYGIYFCYKPLNGSWGDITSLIITSNSITDSSVTTEKIADSAVTSAKLSQELQNKTARLPENKYVLFINELGNVSSLSTFDSLTYCKHGSVTHFYAQSPLSTTLGIRSGAACELRYIDFGTLNLGYQIITAFEEQKIFTRAVNSSADPFSAGNWTEASNNHLIRLGDSSTSAGTWGASYCVTNKVFKGTATGPFTNQMGVPDKEPVELQFFKAANTATEAGYQFITAPLLRRYFKRKVNTIDPFDVDSWEEVKNTETGTISSTAVYPTSSTKTISGTYELNGDYCTISATAQVESGASLMQYSLPVAATGYALVLGAGSGFFFRISTGTTLLTIAQEGGTSFSTNADVTFTLTYKYK